MVLGNSTAQYAFLQIVATTYVQMLANMQSLNCIISPQIYYDCTDTARWFGDIPRIPTVNELSNPGQTQTFQYTDYTSVTWNGLSAKNITALKTTITSAAIRSLAAACLANTTCSAAYNRTKNASSVITSLATTNVNTIQNQLNLYKTQGYNWFPSTGYGLLSNAYGNTPNGADEVYGIHNAVLYGIANKTVNATTYLSQLNLGAMLYGGAAMYESLVHTAAIGSWSPNSQTQSNINLTGTQLFTNVNDGNNVDTRRLRRNINFTPRKRPYQNKWEVWKDEANGIVIPNKEEIFQGFKDRERAKGNIPHDYLTAGPNSFCSPSSSLAEAINYLSPLVSQGCAYESFLSNAASLFTGWKIANDGLAGLAKDGFDEGLEYLADFSNTVTGTTISNEITLCGTGYTGFPCYPATANSWSLAGSGFTIFRLALNVAEFSEPVGAFIGACDLFCALAPAALSLYKQDYSCCNSFCPGPACQSSANGCTQGTGVC